MASDISESKQGKYIKEIQYFNFYSALKQLIALIYLKIFIDFKWSQP